MNDFLGWCGCQTRGRRPGGSGSDLASVRRALDGADASLQLQALRDNGLVVAAASALGEPPRAQVVGKGQLGPGEYFPPDPVRTNIETRTTFGPEVLGVEDGGTFNGHTYAEWLDDVRKQLARATQRLDWLAEDIEKGARVSSMLDNLNFAFLYAETAVRESGYAGQAATTAAEKQAVIDTLVGSLVDYFDRLPGLVGAVAAAAYKEGVDFGRYLERRDSLKSWWDQFMDAIRALLPDPDDLPPLGPSIGAGVIAALALLFGAFALRR